MAQIEIRLPKMGESVTEATITNWLKNIGDTVALDEPLVEVATDKVDNELPSEAEGVLVKQFFNVDDVAQVGDVIAVISTDGEAPAEVAPTVIEEPISTAVEETIVEIQTEVETAAIVNVSNGSTTELSKNGPSGKFYSPLVRSIASKENISMNELEAIEGSGQGGRVTKRDILAYLENGKTTEEISASSILQPSTAPVTSNNTSIPAGSGFLSNIKEPVVTPGPGDEILEMDRMRKMIAEHMVMSKHVSPHVTSFVEADVTSIVEWRIRVKDDFAKRENEKITFTPIFIEAVVKAIKDFPMINVSVAGDKIVKRKNINVGMATALPSGNLIVR